MLIHHSEKKPGIRRYSWGSGLLAAFVLLLQINANATDKFKPFKLKTLEGAQKTLADFSNKVTLVSFFFPSCPYCNAAYPHVQKLYDKYKDQGLSMVWINVVPDENKKIPEWQEKHSFTVPVLIGASHVTLQGDYKLKMTPTHYLLDADGNILFNSAGYKTGSETELEEKIRQGLQLRP